LLNGFSLLIFISRETGEFFHRLCDVSLNYLVSDKRERKCFGSPKYSLLGEILLPKGQGYGRGPHYEAGLLHGHRKMVKISCPCFVVDQVVGVLLLSLTCMETLIRS
jgi:hypothetical protein